MNLWCDRLFKKISFAIAVIIFMVSGLQAFDVPVFYRAPLFQGKPASSADSWVAYPKIRYVYSDARKSFDSHSKSVSLLSTNGFFDLGKLGVNVQTLKPLTKVLWDPTVIPGPPPTLTGEFAAGPDIPVEVSGRFLSHQFDISWRQNIMAGFFVEAYLPVKWIEIDKVKFVNKGEEKVGKSASTAKVVDDFIKNELDPILKENGFISIKTPFKDSGFGDLIIAGGWQSEICTNVGFIDLVLGQLKIGMILPLAGKRDIDHVFALPIGNDQFLGVLGRFNLEVGLWKLFRFGASIGTEIFFTEERTERVATSKNQRGWIFLEKAKVKKDLGSIWDLLAYAEGREVIGALSVLLGVSYTKQERTQLSIRDDNYLKTFIKEQKALATIVSQNDIANSNDMLANWEQYVLHLLLEYDLKLHKNVWIAPKFSFAADLPFYGRRTFKANAFGGSMALMIDFAF